MPDLKAHTNSPKTSSDPNTIFCSFSLYIVAKNDVHDKKRFLLVLSNHNTIVPIVAIMMVVKVQGMQTACCYENGS